MFQSQLLFVSVFNYGVIEMAKNHIKSLHNHGHTNTMSFVTDQASMDILTALGYPCTLVLETDIGQEKKDFGTCEFNHMSYLRYHCISKLQEKNYNLDIWYMDVDTVVLTNLTDCYRGLKKTGLNVCFQNDINMMCTGCMLLFASRLTRDFVKIVWENKTQNYNDQLLVKELLSTHSTLIRYKPLTPELFPCGVLYFGDDFVKIPVQIASLRTETQLRMSQRPPMFVHANWMIGDEKKIAALKKYGLWFL